MDELLINDEKKARLRIEKLINDNADVEKIKNQVDKYVLNFNDWDLEESSILDKRLELCIMFYEYVEENESEISIKLFAIKLATNVAIRLQKHIPELEEYIDLRINYSKTLDDAEECFDSVKAKLSMMVFLMEAAPSKYIPLIEELLSFELEKAPKKLCYLLGDILEHCYNVENIDPNLIFRIIEFKWGNDQKLGNDYRLIVVIDLKIEWYVSFDKYDSTRLELIYQKIALAESTTDIKIKASKSHYQAQLFGHLCELHRNQNLPKNINQKDIGVLFQEVRQRTIDECDYVLRYNVLEHYIGFLTHCNPNHHELAQLKEELNNCKTNSQLSLQIKEKLQEIKTILDSGDYEIEAIIEDYDSTSSLCLEMGDLKSLELCCRYKYDFVNSLDHENELKEEHLQRILDISREYDFSILMSRVLRSIIYIYAKNNENESELVELLTQKSDNDLQSEYIEGYIWSSKFLLNKLMANRESDQYNIQQILNSMLEVAIKKADSQLIFWILGKKAETQSYDINQRDDVVIQHLELVISNIDDFIKPGSGSDLLELVQCIRALGVLYSDYVTKIIEVVKVISDDLSFTKFTTFRFDWMKDHIDSFSIEQINMAATEYLNIHSLQMQTYPEMGLYMSIALRNVARYISCNEGYVELRGRLIGIAKGMYNAETEAKNLLQLHITLALVNSKTKRLKKFPSKNAHDRYCWSLCKIADGKNAGRAKQLSEGIELFNLENNNLLVRLSENLSEPNVGSSDGFVLDGPNLLHRGVSFERGDVERTWMKIKRLIESIPDNYKILMYCSLDMLTENEPLISELISNKRVSVFTGDCSTHPEDMVFMSLARYYGYHLITNDFLRSEKESYPAFFNDFDKIINFEWDVESSDIRINYYFCEKGLTISSEYQTLLDDANIKNILDKKCKLEVGAAKNIITTKRIHRDRIAANSNRMRSERKLLLERRKKIDSEYRQLKDLEIKGARDEESVELMDNHFEKQSELLELLKENTTESASMLDKISDYDAELNRASAEIRLLNEKLSKLQDKATQTHHELQQSVVKLRLHENSIRDNNQ